MSNTRDNGTACVAYGVRVDGMRQTRSKKRMQQQQSATLFTKDNLAEPMSSIACRERMARLALECIR